ncbi:DEP domain-containing protein DDB_G0279099-like [Oppia nitens]|uniref:DEP domain-containing protein DDB_G0279099-like n=1 Tax=Oppia nitens TaxID=1686743 RepID=UPI0023DB01F4|nr:DEP domain-containing protein DDB_G0279099-like [Oppia nitens]
MRTKSVIKKADLSAKQLDNKTIKPIGGQKVCNRCKNHNVKTLFKGHSECPYKGCPCVKCKNYGLRLKRKCELARLKKPQTRAVTQQMDKHKDNELSKSMSNKQTTQKKSLEINTNSSKKSTAKKRINGRTGGTRKTQITNTETNSETDGNGNNNDDNDFPPQLIPEQTVTTPDEVNQTQSGDNQTGCRSDYLCAQYLKSSQELSQKLSNSPFSESELMAYLKYSVLSDCLGDVNLATQRIICAAQELRRGAAFMVQNPNLTNEDKGDTSNRNHQSFNHRNGEPKEPVTNGRQYCSTFINNHQSKAIVNYSPAMTPIRPN